MCASIPARLLFLGLETEAFDDGVFVYQPVTLKARIFPADSIDVNELLEELEGLDMIRRFESGGRQYGVIWDFLRRQRPKKPNSSNIPLGSELATFVGTTGRQQSGTGSEPAPHQSGNDDEAVLDRCRNGSEIPSQREEGKGNGKGNGTQGDAIASPDRPAATTIRRYMEPDAIPTEEDRRYALEAVGMTPEQLDQQWRQFVDWNIARGAASTDWRMNWKSWCDRYPEIQDNVLRMRRRAS